MANAYFGSWSGGGEQVEPWLDFMQKTYPDKAVVISEYGYVGPFAPNAAEADRQRIANLHQQLDAFARRDFVAGAIFWIYQDYNRNYPDFSFLSRWQRGSHWAVEKLKSGVRAVGMEEPAKRLLGRK